MDEVFECPNCGNPDGVTRDSWVAAVTVVPVDGGADTYTLHVDRTRCLVAVRSGQIAYIRQLTPLPAGR